jgi:hypothetical protein
LLAFWRLTYNVEATEMYEELKLPISGNRLALMRKYQRFLALSIFAASLMSSQSEILWNTNSPQMFAEIRRKG